MNNIRRYNAARHVHRLYCGVSKDGKTMTVFAYTVKEAKADLKKKGFMAVRVVQT